ncbi:MAG TPA: hypothetical protein PLU49_03295 [Saprospiraceae bacterium]|nr:hypothetical protein [Saprospiraceae bacterium]
MRNKVKLYTFSVFIFFTWFSCDKYTHKNEEISISRWNEITKHDFFENYRSGEFQMPKCVRIGPSHYSFDHIRHLDSVYSDKDTFCLRFLKNNEDSLIALISFPDYINAFTTFCRFDTFSNKLSINSNIYDLFDNSLFYDNLCIKFIKPGQRIYEIQSHWCGFSPEPRDIYGMEAIMYYSFHAKKLKKFWVDPENLAIIKDANQVLKKFKIPISPSHYTESENRLKQIMEVLYNTHRDAEILDTIFILKRNIELGMYVK